jgi:hypothetical protein
MAQHDFHHSRCSLENQYMSLLRCRPTPWLLSSTVLRPKYFEDLYIYRKSILDIIVTCQHIEQVPNHVCGIYHPCGLYILVTNQCGASTPARRGRPCLGPGLHWEDAGAPHRLYTSAGGITYTFIFLLSVGRNYGVLIGGEPNHNSQFGRTDHFFGVE